MTSATCFSMTSSLLPGLLLPQLLLALLLLLHVTAPYAADAATLANACTRVCGAFERCFQYDGAEHCVQLCAPGRCDDATHVCVLQGVECAQAPCLPRAVCEPSTVDDGTPADAADACTRTCPLVDSPVCASDGVTYANTCFFAEAQCRSPGLEVRGRGLCDADRAFALTHNPPQLLATSSSPSAADAKCDAIVCADVLDPVCASTGTLQNACHLKREQCKHPDVELLHRGACEASAVMPRCPANCTHEFVPVCTSTGRVYANECLFRQAKCARPFATGFVARDLADCELNLGDSASAVQDYRAALAPAFD